MNADKEKKDICKTVFNKVIVGLNKVHLCGVDCSCQYLTCSRKQKDWPQFMEFNQKIKLIKLTASQVSLVSPYLS